ncbi:MAG TPA: CoA transferase, partial [Acidimicrobiales bacterium]|nr:CoA transferase [Acidimicrobiales bacterium]
MTGLLGGVRIIEFSEIIAGPWGGMMLADLGADVIKVEPVAGEPWRHQLSFAPDESRWFIAANRGKRDLAVDLRSPQGQDLVHRLVATADAVIVNYRPGTPADLAIDYETLAGINPRLIYVEATAFGRRGPAAHRPGYDLIVQAVTGLLAADGKRSEAGMPAPMSPPVADYGTGYAVAWAVCAGLFSRERTGQGLKIEASLLSVALGMLSYGFMEMPDLPTPDAVERVRNTWRGGASNVDVERHHAEELSRAASVNAYYRCYETADSLIAVAALSNPLRRKFLAVVGLEDPRLDDPALATGRAAAEAGVVLVAMTEIRMRERTTAEWLKDFDAGGVPAGPVNIVHQLVDDPHIQANELVLEQD